MADKPASIARHAACQSPKNSPEDKAILRPTPPTLVFFGSKAMHRAANSLNFAGKNPIS
jgi:hypothetical protein